MITARAALTGAVLLSLAACDDRSATTALSPAFSASAPMASAAVASAVADWPGCADPVAAAHRLLQATPPGPAAAAITDDRVVSPFQLEGRLTADPVPAGYTPQVSAPRAACELQSWYSLNNFGAAPGRLALASVTIASGLRPSEADTGPAVSLGPLPSYTHRAAWILVTTANNDLNGCPTAIPSSAAAPSGLDADPYEVFVMDAATGTATVAFEDSYILCGEYPADPPSEWQPWQVASVPWTLISRAPDGSSAVTSADWPACEYYRDTGAGYGGPGSTTTPPDATLAHAPLGVEISAF